MLAAYLQTGKLVTPRRSQKQWEFLMLAMFRNIISLHSKGKLGNEIFQLREENLSDVSNGTLADNSSLLEISNRFEA